MNITYFFSAFGTFGNPNGFRQSYFLGGHADIVKNIRTFDLKTDAVKLFPGSRLYGIRKEAAGSSSLISYSVYTFAKEQNSQRGGTFIGSSLIFVDKITSESITIAVLDEFHQYLEQHNVADGTITINHSDKFSIDKPKDYDKISLNIREPEDGGAAQQGNNYLVVYSEINPGALQQLFSKATALLNSYDMIYFTGNHEVAEFVQQKGIFKIVDLNGFEREIQKSDEEKSRLLNTYISDLELEKNNLNDDKKHLLDQLNQQISQNEKRHKENAAKISESKDGILAINQEFEQYAGKINTLISSLKSEGKVEAVKKQHLEIRKVFADKIRQRRDIGTISSIASQAPVNQPYVKPALGNSLEDFSRGNSQGRERKFNGYKIAFWSLLLLLTGAAACYLIFIDGGKMIGLPTEEAVAVENNSNDTVRIENTVSETPAVQTFNLNPFPNNELNENDWRLVSKKAPPGMKIDSLINVIYKENPSTINDYYKHQKKEYKARLYALNEKNFEIRGNDTVLADTVRKIPNFKLPGSNNEPIR
ncbi:hypothetical protein [Chryseobacterium shigense]|uniref:Antitoxin component HigA of HigAB toxin-antitoxin module n=1 Tax=Chryseobacterium shigense TaxID=297244 RepID=A0A841NB13_9FLAO|nr:hypothetical protein [Chryseobacterium shigense]MBB6370570.1 antitoxin component HigA of HigAB toxin-antitoxin module [Chryseobacterium shigense]